MTKRFRRCAEDDCCDLVVKRGFCNRHYQQRRIQGLIEPKPSVFTVSAEALAQVLPTVLSMAAALKKLGFNSTSHHARNAVRRQINEYGLSTDHFLKSGWNAGSRYKGRTSQWPSLLRKGVEVNTPRLKMYLIRDGVKKAECEECGLKKWRGKTAPLELDHINGNRLDNRLENLRVLCANCHAQTETYCRKKGT